MKREQPMTASRSDEVGLDPVAARVARFIAGQMPGAKAGGSPAEPGAVGFEQRLAKYRQARRSQKWFMVGVMSVATVFAAALGGSRLVERLQAGVLSYTIDGALPSPGGFLPVSDSADSLLAFSDGSRVRMAARAQGRVVEISRRGARFALQAGKASVDVVHNPTTQWLFEVGPFLVTVHGTSFTVAWSPADALFEMRLASGAVSVTGPVAGREVPLRAGQTLRVSLREETSTIAPATAAEVGGSPGAELPADSESSPPATAPAAPVGRQVRLPSSRWSPRDWAAAVADGKATAVLAEAERRGLPTVLDLAAGDDLWALANAARYVGRYGLAQQALVAQRRRFPGSERALEAAFLLGRLAEGAAAGPEEALAWYDRYLVEAPDGPHISDALGRKMTVLERCGRRDDALTVARDYLQRYPRGIYANAARAMLRAHR
jgi:TolA-binding protein